MEQERAGKDGQQEQGGQRRSDNLPEENNNQIPNNNPPPPPPPPQKCPRCDSENTKFCYFNNYSLSQPRYLCKTCRRYWTHGGNLRNIPVGGGSGVRKGKRLKTATDGEISNRSPPLNPPPPVTLLPHQQQLLQPSAAPQLMAAALAQSLSTGLPGGINLPWAGHARTTGFFSSAGPIFQGFNFPPSSMNQPPGFQGRNHQQPAVRGLMNYWMINNDGENNINPSSSNFSSFWNNNSGGGGGGGGGDAGASSSSMAGTSESNPNQWLNDADSP